MFTFDPSILFLSRKQRIQSMSNKSLKKQIDHLTYDPNVSVLALMIT